MRLNRSIGILAGVCVLASMANAQGLSSVQVIKPERTSSAVLRAGPPGLFGIPGTKIGETGEDDKYAIVDGLDFPVFFGFDRWLRVVPIVDQEIRTSSQYWIRVGKPNENSNKFVYEDLCKDLNQQKCDMYKGIIKALRDSK